MWYVNEILAGAQVYWKVIEISNTLWSAICELCCKGRKEMTCFDPTVNIEAEMLKIIGWI
jgi:hypothetical protein